jgi:hypothetical protein
LKKIYFQCNFILTFCEESLYRQSLQEEKEIALEASEFWQQNKRSIQGFSHFKICFLCVYILFKKDINNY